jgi:hypothetical protein
VQTAREVAYSRIGFDTGSNMIRPRPPSQSRRCRICSILPLSDREASAPKFACRDGSIASFWPRIDHFWSTPITRHSQHLSACLESANAQDPRAIVTSTGHERFEILDRGSRGRNRRKRFVLVCAGSPMGMVAGTATRLEKPLAIKAMPTGVER